MAAVASIQITVDGSGAVTAINNVKNEVQAMAPAFEVVGRQSNVILTQMSKDHDHARESARLLREETGIFLPRALQGLIAQSQILGPVLNTAFSAFAVVGFIEVLAGIPKHVEAVIESLTHQKAATEVLAKSHEELRKLWSESAAEEQKFQEQLDLIGKKGSERMAVEAATAHQDANLLAGRLQMLQQMEKAQEALNAQTDAATRKNAGIFAPAVGTTAEHRDQQVALGQIKTLVQQMQNEYDKATNRALLLDLQQKQTFGEETQKHIQETTKQLEEFNKSQEKALNQIYATNARDAVKQYEQDMKDWQKAQTEIDEAISHSVDTRVGSMAQQHKEVSALEADMHKSADAEKKQAQEAAREWTRARDQMANSIDSFFNDITSGNIGKSFLKQFEKMVSQMVATWLMGVRGLSAATGSTLFGSVPGAPMGTSGGILGSIMNLGSGGGAFPAGGALSGSSALGSPIFSGFNNSFTGPEATMLGLPLSAGGGAGTLVPSTMPAGGSNAAAFGGIGGLFSKFGGIASSLLPLGLLAGVGSLGVGFKGPGQGALTGALGTGLGLGALAFLGTQSSLFAGAGLFAASALSGPFAPITLGIGALIGGLIGLFGGNGKLKKQQTAVLQDEQHQLDLLQRSYDLHQIDYNSAISQAEQLRVSYTQQQEQLSKGGSVGRVGPWIDALEQHINAVESQRQNALAAAANYGPPQFHSGGYVERGMSFRSPGFPGARQFHTGGVVNANLLEGEGVVNRTGMQALGRRGLNALNKGSGAPIAIQLTVNALDGKSIEAIPAWK